VSIGEIGNRSQGRGCNGHPIHALALYRNYRKHAR
jgi:hypothetical protein